MITDETNEVVKDEVEVLSHGAVSSLRLYPVRNKLRSKIGSFRTVGHQGSRRCRASKPCETERVSYGLIQVRRQESERKTDMILLSSFQDVVDLSLFSIDSI